MNQKNRRKSLFGHKSGTYQYRLHPMGLPYYHENKRERFRCVTSISDRQEEVSGVDAARFK